ncbi:uncharacterized protein FIESC28_10916 [Fusarium coffeatum]|uniref:Uncharacterized protein n=1 Tax=Fusarium coffeatum TaxID=231269 RepID=A0A366QPP1_9HYPO|nr:uncharacterized protein FIESC28_10916 [Fusarium coffeatum]RBR06881.1 hypothetical protein FIESC28_10916 [Fusarium coffeatum]
MSFTGTLPVSNPYTIPFTEPTRAGHVAAPDSPPSSTIYVKPTRLTLTSPGIKKRKQKTRTSSSRNHRSPSLDRRSPSPDRRIPGVNLHLFLDTLSKTEMDEFTESLYKRMDELKKTGHSDIKPLGIPVSCFSSPFSKDPSEEEPDLDRHHNEISHEDLDGYMEVLQNRLERLRLRERVKKFMISAIFEDKIGPHLREES